MEKESIILWGNPQDVLRVIYDVIGDGKHDRQYIGGKQLGDIACYLSLLGFDCHLSFYRHGENHERMQSFDFSAGDKWFSCRTPEGGDHYAVAVLKHLAEFITNHTEKDGMFHYTYSM